MAKAEPERAGYVRISLTIPADLKDEMETVAKDENWSAWAAECFRRRVTDIKASSRTGGSMKKVIERLKAAAESEGQDDFVEGQKLGREWAADNATPGQLRRLAEYNSNDPWEGTPMAPLGWSGVVAMAIDPKLEDTRDHDEFWERAVGDDCSRVEHDDDGPAAFLRGFVAGAVELWDEVKDKV